MHYTSVEADDTATSQLPLQFAAVEPENCIHAKYPAGGIHFGVKVNSHYDLLWSINISYQNRNVAIHAVKMLRFVHFSKVCAQHVDDPPPMYCNSFCFVLQYLLKQFVARGSVQLTFFFFFVRINNKKFKRLWVASIFALCSQVTRHDLPCFNFAAAHFKRLSYKTLMQIRDHLKKVS